MKAHM